VSYIGVQPTAGQYRKLDDISASFNGSTTSFTTSVGGTNVTAGTAQQLLVSVGGVIQEPDADYTVSTNTITFTTAPASGLDFFAVLMGDALNTVTTSDGSITTAKLAGSLSVGLAAGTNSAPSLYFTGDSNTGVYSPGADQLAISTGGTGRLFIDSSGRLLVGTSTARSNFFGTTLSSLTQTEGTGGSTARGALSVINNDVSNNPAYVLLGRSGAATLGSNAAVVSGSRLGTLTFHGADGTSFIEAATVAGEVDGTPGTNDMPGRLVFSTTADGAASPTERLRITSAGLVGIGTTTPATTLEVNGTSYVTDLLIRNNAGTPSLGTSPWLYSPASGALAIATNASERVRIDSSGRLLVGTSSARSFVGTERLVQIEGTSGSTTNLSITRNSNDSGSGNLFLGKSRGTANGSNTIVQSGDGLGGVYFNGTDGTQFVTGAFIACEVDGTPGANDMPGRLVFSTTADGASGSTERVRIANNGNFYIGGGTSFGASGWTTQNAGCQVSQYSPTSDTRTLYQWQSDNAGTNTTAVYIESTGKIYARTTTVQAIASERRLKENIAPVDQTESWSTVRDLPYYKYNFIGSDPTNVVYGPIADEVPDEMRVATSQSDDVGVIHTYDNAMLQARSFVALQAALKRIETLEAKVAALEGA
jgi:hypothetical protein